MTIPKCNRPETQTPEERAFLVAVRTARQKKHQIERDAEYKQFLAKQAESKQAESKQV